MSVLVALAQYPKIETARLILRPMTKDDLDDYHAFTSNDDHLRYAFFPHRSMEESWEGLVLYNLKEPIGKYGIVEKSSNRLIGNIHFKLTEQPDTLELGYTLHHAYTGQGYMTEAAQALTSLAMQLPNVNRLTATVDQANLASKAVLEKLGMTVIKSYPATSLRGKQTVFEDYQLDLTSF
ncbi:GNAT family N-acetyltransferase [Streptococcus suis]|nr:GNAT family N-acetyltransferase [Streptococcus suis]